MLSHRIWTARIWKLEVVMRAFLAHLVCPSCIVIPSSLFAQSEGAIRSSLQTVEVPSGRIQTVHSDDLHFEAPNWSPDGRFFVVNSDGRLYRLPTRGDKRFEEIPTGFATRVNNDHGFSPDGRQIVISHHADEHITDEEQDWLAASIYVLPSVGSPTPVKVTANAPSFWHGWSPDGKTLAFVGLRGGEWDIYAIPVAGGEERRLTTGCGLDDGPDYSPDGEFIYYNSFCSGKMEIWRMRSDGSRPEQLTRDDSSNWFPHPSPDGRWLVFLAYLEDQGEDHPFGRRVKLRLMDLRDFSVRDLTPPFFGGQGTLNVPSWSPDSRQVAFVAYEIRSSSSIASPGQRLGSDVFLAGRFAPLDFLFEAPGFMPLDRCGPVVVGSGPGSNPWNRTGCPRAGESVGGMPPLAVISRREKADTCRRDFAARRSVGPRRVWRSSWESKMPYGRQPSGRS